MGVPSGAVTGSCILVMMFGMIFFTSTVGEIFALTLLAPVWSRNVTWMPSPSAISLLSSVPLGLSIYSIVTRVVTRARRHQRDSTEAAAALPRAEEVPLLG